MTFYDIPAEGLPEGHRYYFNVLMICIAISPQLASEIFPVQGLEELYFVDQITDIRPVAYHIYIEPELGIWEVLEEENLEEEQLQDEEGEELDSELECEIQLFPHSVVEIAENGEISFFDMLDFDTRDLWRID